jgi:hypothetical protein
MQSVNRQIVGTPLVLSPLSSGGYRDVGGDIPVLEPKGTIDSEQRLKCILPGFLRGRIVAKLTFVRRWFCHVVVSRANRTCGKYST